MYDIMCLSIVIFVKLTQCYSVSWTIFRVDKFCTSVTEHDVTDKRKGLHELLS